MGNLWEFCGNFEVILWEICGNFMGLPTDILLDVLVK